MRRLPALVRTGLAALLLGGAAASAQAGNQQYEPLAASVQAALHAAVADQAPLDPSFQRSPERARWLAEMSQRLARRIPDETARSELLRAVHYEATRAGLDPQLVLGLVQVESGFRTYAISEASARGLMQVMPFWVRQIGTPSHNLFDMYTNLRYGCTILRHYLDIEQGDLYRALGRYNGSLGQPEYPNMVLAAWKVQWNWRPGQAKAVPVTAAATKPSM